MFRLIKIGLFIAIGIASLGYVGSVVYNIIKGSKSRMERDIDEALLKTRKEDK